MSVPATPAPAPSAPVPGKTLGIVGLILAIFTGFIGAIVSGIALAQSRRAGVKNGPAVAGLIIGIVLTVIWIVVFVLIAIAGAGLVGGLSEICAELGAGVWEVDGVTYTCG